MLRGESRAKGRRLRLGLTFALLALAAACTDAQIGSAPSLEASHGDDTPYGPDAGLQELPDAAPPDLEPTPVNLRHNTSSEIADENSIACLSSDTGAHAENSYYRIFDLAGEFGIAGALDIESVTVGVERAIGNGGQQPIVVALHTLEGALLRDNLTELTAVEVTVTDQARTLLEVPIQATAPAGSVLVAEVLIPLGLENGHHFMIGSNREGQGGPTYIRAPSEGCDLTEPADAATIGFPNMHLVLEVAGETLSP